MADDGQVTWVDVLSLIFFLSVFFGVIAAVIIVSRTVSESVQTTRDSLKQRGFTLSQEGLAVKTDKRFDREHYIDATQRGMMNFPKSAISFRNVEQERKEAEKELKHRDSNASKHSSHS